MRTRGRKLAMMLALCGAIICTPVLSLQAGELNTEAAAVEESLVPTAEVEEEIGLDNPGIIVDTEIDAAVTEETEAVEAIAPSANVVEEDTSNTEAGLKEIGEEDTPLAGNHQNYDLLALLVLPVLVLIVVTMMFVIYRKRN